MPLAHFLEETQALSPLLEETQALTNMDPNSCLPLEEIEKWNEDFNEAEMDEIEISSDDEETDKENIEDTGLAISHSVAIESANNLIKWCQ